MSEIKKDVWKWIVGFTACVTVYLILDVADTMSVLRQMLIMPVCFLLWIFCAATGWGLHAVWTALDVDVPWRAAPLVQVCAFALILAFTMIPMYLYLQTRKKIYLGWTLIAIAWIISTACWVVLLIIAMTGMMD